MYYKYPRTYHLPNSPGRSKDDKILYNLSSFEDKQVVITEKRDGECTTMYKNYIHARSINSKHHNSRDWIKNYHASIAHNIPKDMRICGENLTAKHSIAYKLETYWEAFSVWEGKVCLSWEDSLEWFELLGMTHVPIIYEGIFHLEIIKNIQLDTAKQEGYVVRLVDSFLYENFQKSVVKWVRRNHVQTDIHWTKKWRYNDLL